MQMRFPALLWSNAVAFGFDLSMLHICSYQGPVYIARALAVRLFALALGMGRDLYCRYIFMREQQGTMQKQQQKQQ
jgi:hypothetical protein